MLSTSSFRVVLLATTATIIASSSTPVVVAAAAPYFDDIADTDRVVYENWWIERGESLYPKNVFLPMVTEPTNGAAVHWTLATYNHDADIVAIGRNTESGGVDSTTAESEATHIQFAVVVRAEGWVGFGISEAGQFFVVNVFATVVCLESHFVTREREQLNVLYSPLDC